MKGEDFKQWMEDNKKERQKIHANIIRTMHDSELLKELVDPEMDDEYIEVLKVEILKRCRQ